MEVGLNNIGSVYLKQRNFREAERVFFERKRLDEKIKPNRLRHPGLTEGYILTGRYSEALELIQLSFPTWRDNRNTHIEYHTQMGLALKGKKAYREAAKYLFQAAKLVEEMREETAEKTEFFLEDMTGAVRKITSLHLPENLRNREEDMINQLAYLEGRWKEALKRGEGAVKELQNKREEVKARLDSLVNELRTGYPRYAALH